MPAMDWIEELPKKVRDKFVALLELLSEQGDKLGRPHLGHLEKKIYELRVAHKGNQYRLLCFFDGTRIVVMSNGFMKKTQKVPKKEMDLALKRMKKYLQARTKHSF